jgi:hypothetical protein
MFARAGRFRLIHAPWIFRKTIARERERSRPGAAAEIAELAFATLAAKIVGIAERTEKRGIAIDVHV